MSEENGNKPPITRSQIKQQEITRRLESNPNGSATFELQIETIFRLIDENSTELLEPHISNFRRKKVN